MRLACAISTPEVHPSPPVALLSGDFAERLAKASVMGYDGVELMVARPDELDAAALREQVARAGLEIAAIASGAVYMMDGLTLLAADADVAARAAARMDGLIAFAAAVGAPIVTIGGFRGRLASAGGGEQARERLVQALRVAAIHAAERNVRLALEPLNRYESDIINTAAECLALCQEVDRTHLGLLLDTYHVNIEEASVSGAFRLGLEAGRLWHVHLGDNNRLAPGQGHMDFATIVTALHEGGYSGYLSAELLPLPDPDAAAAATIRHMRRFIPKENGA